MPLITLDVYDGQRSLGRINLPPTVQSAVDEFKIDYAVKGGGNGLVVAAKQYTDGSIKRTCAVKFLRRLDPQRKDRFENEIRIAQILKHPNIAEFFGSGKLPPSLKSVPWMAQELGGINFREEVQKRGQLKKELFIKVALQMCDATECLHSHGFIHRDIKPDNFVWVENSNDQCLMVDFGIAKRLTEDVSGRALDQFTRNQEFVGPQQYSSPELIAYSNDKSVKVDERSDIFQLGKTFWFLATGRVSAGVPAKKLCPFEGELHGVIVQILADDPDERIQTVAEVREAIRTLKVR